MRIPIHHPVMLAVRTGRPPGGEVFHTIRLTDGDGSVILFIKGDWSDWDALVDAVAQHRAQQEV